MLRFVSLANECTFNKRSPLYYNILSGHNVHWWTWYRLSLTWMFTTINFFCFFLHLGSQRKIQFQFCSCYSEVVDTLIKLGYFTATPQHPQLAFQFQLLDLLEALLLECQVAVKYFTSALACISRCPLQVTVLIGMS